MKYLLHKRFKEHVKNKTKKNWKNKDHQKLLNDQHTIAYKGPIIVISVILYSYIQLEDSPAHRVPIYLNILCPKM